jgi:[acyl-carrier-protein] S-malonyltransferase
MGGVRTSMVSVIFPGQGSQHVGMGEDICGGSSAAADVFKTADESLDFSVSDVCFNGPAEKLSMTQYCQPAIFTLSYACWAALKERVPGFKPSMLAGHSLGELTALAAAGCMSFKAGLELVRERGILMARAGDKSKGAMAAALGLETKKIKVICREHNVSPANMNCPGQVVISGAVDDVAKASAGIKAAGGKVIPLKVAGAFHSEYMKQAACSFSSSLEQADLKTPGVPVYSNVTGASYDSVAGIRQGLTRQLYSPVLWQVEVERMAAGGAGVFIEAGPGMVLSKLVQKILPGARVLSVQDRAGLEGAESFLRGADKVNLKEE